MTQEAYDRYLQERRIREQEAPLRKARIIAKLKGLGLTGVSVEWHCHALPGAISCFVALDLIVRPLLPLETLGSRTLSRHTQAGVC